MQTTYGGIIVGTPWQEDRDDMLARALSSGYEAGVAQFGDDLSSWRWGELHTSEFVHNPLGQSGIAALENLFNRGPVATGGSAAVINKTGWSANNPYIVSSIPALRQIVDLGDLSNTLMIHSTGQSGHPGHPHYDDFIDPWRLLEYHPSHWDRADVEPMRMIIWCWSRPNSSPVSQHTGADEYVGPFH